MEPEAFLNVLPIMVWGMLGIFAVTGIIVGLVTILNNITSN